MPLVTRLFRWTLVAILVLGAVELLFRLAVFPGWRDLQHDMYVPHPVYEHYTRPNLDIRRLNPGNWDVRVHTNRMGMRGRDASLEADLAGLWVMGDSNTFGGYVEDDEVYVARLAGLGWRAANLASEGHDLVHQARLLKWLIAQGPRPQGVVAAVTVYHGIKLYEGALAALEDTPAEAPYQPVTRSGAMATLQGELLRVADGLPRSGLAIRSFLRANSAVYGWVKSGVMAIPALREVTLRLGMRIDVDMVYPFGPDLLSPMTEGNPALAEVRATADLLAGIGALVRRELGVPFAVVLLPGNHQVHPAAFERWRAAQGLQGEDLDPLRAMHALEAELAARGVPALDVLQPLRASPDRVIFPDDNHLNAVGHRIVAEAMAAWLPGAMGGERRP
jgi:hypothetical protein